MNYNRLDGKYPGHKVQVDIKYVLNECIRFPCYGQRYCQITAIDSGLRSEQRNIDTSAAWRIVSRKVTRSLFFGKAWNVTRTAAAVLLPL